MAEIILSNSNPSRRVSENAVKPSPHLAWVNLMRYCEQIGHGEIERLKIQDGLPMAAEVTIKKVKFSP
jgi:hypothetical protein